MTFDTWWAELLAGAKKVNWKLGEKETYREFFDDGDTPAEALLVDFKFRK